MRKIFHKLVSVEEALKIVEGKIRLNPLGIEEIEITKSVGRILAEDIIADLDLPPFDRATMDGYAVRAEDTYNANEENPIALKVIGKVELGEEVRGGVKCREAFEISTGAPIPIGANAVVMVEYTEREDDELKVYRPVRIGENIAQAGSDLMLGETILRAGEKLGRREVGVLAALGRRFVKVYKFPKVAIISTGNELIPPGERMLPYKMYDINTYSIMSAVIEDRGIPIILGIVKDEEEAIRSRIIEALEIADILLISGGTSAGVGDTVYRVLGNINGSEIIVHGLKTKPGKPTVIATVNGKLVIGLPGWPISSLMIYSLIVEPILMKMVGYRGAGENCLKIKIARKIRCERGRMNLIPISIIVNEKGEKLAYPLMEHSDAIATLKRSDGYIIIPEDREVVEEGEEVMAKLFSSQIEIPDITVIGSHCPALEFMVKIIEEKGYKVKLINTGSMDGLIAIMNGEADIAGIHILDGEKLEYNVPILEKMTLENIVLVRGYYRMQGLILAKGNPKNIRGLEDLLRDDVKFVNRNKGSGTRILLDYMLTKMAEEKGHSFHEIRNKIKGYYIEAKTHSSIASAIRFSKADVGVGIRTTAIQYDLEFIPIREEEYDFLIKKDSLKKEAVKEFIKILKGEKFKDTLKIMGMDIPKNIGEIIFSR